jgi:hypothetical protein
VNTDRQTNSDPVFIFKPVINLSIVHPVTTTVPFPEIPISEKAPERPANVQSSKNSSNPSGKLAFELMK